MRVRGTVARALAAALAVFTFCGTGPAHADPADIFSVGAPTIGTAPPKASDINAGDSSVASQTGAFQYSYPIAVPPGRNGMEPHLALSYSSQAPIYGGVANGWSLSVPLISEDTSSGRLWWQDPSQTGKRYQSSMAGGRPLIAVSEPAASDVVATYRAQNDATFTRYERLQAGGAWWRARTTDGATYTFGDPDHVNGVLPGTPGCTIVSDEYAPLTHVEDSFQNAIDYYYEAGVDGECRLALVTWGQNRAASIADFARLKLTYSVPTVTGCPAGAFVGAQTSYRTGKKIVTGASELDSIVATAYVPGDSGNAVHTRTITLGYTPDAGVEQTATCSASHAAYRSLYSIHETAVSSASPLVDLPAIKFTYGSAQFGSGALSWGASSISVPWPGPQGPGGTNFNLGWGYRFNTNDTDSTRWPTVEAMMLDVDGDGLQDRVVSAPFNDASGRLHCGAKWYRNNGGFSFSSTGLSIAMPTLKWASAATGGTPPTPPPQCGDPGMYSGSLQPNTQGSPAGYVEGCSLNYQRTNYTNTSTGSVASCASGASCNAWNYCDTPGSPDYGAACGPNVTPGPTYFSYRWIDIDGDGLVDLVASPATGSVYNLEWGTGLCPTTPPAEPAIFGRFPSCPQTPYTTAENSRAPTMCGGMYPYFVYRNRGNGQFGAPPADPADDPGSPAPDKILYEPTPLEADNGLSSLTASPVGQDVGTLDLDGDGFPDGVSAPNQAATWKVYRNDFTGRFSTATGAIAFNFATPGEWISDTGYTAADANGLAYPVSKAGVIDINGDGLADHWTSTNNDTNASIEFNDGASFRAPELTTSVRPAADGTLSCLTSDCTGAKDCPGGSQTCFTVNARREDSNRTIDVDLDGRVDVVRAGAIGAVATTSLNQGGPFSDPLSTPVGDPTGLEHQIVASQHVDSPRYTWEIRSDMIDLDGDGIPEGLDFGDHDGGAGSVTLARIPTPTQPPRLLVEVNNQRGATTSISYAAITNPAVVTRDAGLVMPRTAWVVQSLKTTDSLSATTTTTSYRYKNPHFSPEGDLLPEQGIDSPLMAPGTSKRYDFRGFEEVTATGQSGALSIQRYGYDIDWSGRLTTSLVVPAEAPTEVRSIDETTWEPRYLFCDLHLGCSLKTYHVTKVDHWTCKNGQDETACRANTDTFTRAVSTLSELSSSTSSGPALLWKATSARLQSAVDAHDGDRITDTGYLFAADATNYRLLPASDVHSSQLSGAPVMFSKTVHTFDASDRVALTDEVWVDSTDADRAITRRVYDMNTGNALQRWKPVQNAANTYPTYYTYDTRQLFVSHEKSEPVGYAGSASREMDYVYEPGTGTKIDTLGPNVSWCSVQNPPVCAPGALTREEHKITVDALGRVLTRSETFTDNSLDYGTSLHTTEIDSYVDSSPQSVTHKAALYKDSNWNITYSQDQTDLDGLGRPIKKTVFVFGSAPLDEVTTYHWSNDGTLGAVDVPDPAANDGTVVTYSYTYDSLGRPTTMTRPDGGTPKSGFAISYDSLAQTTTEQVGAAGGFAASSTTTKDAFGRLATVDEQVDALHSARTSYAYDPADRVDQVVDPEGSITALVHDFAGRRTEIKRGTRVWTYGYDRNGNMTSVTTPCAGVGCEASYTTTIAYDNLDEPTSKLIALRDMSLSDRQYFGVDHEQLRWDYLPNAGGNTKGYLSYWLGYGPSASYPKVEVNNGFTAQGRIRVVNEFFNDSLGGYAALSRSVNYFYHPNGALSQESFGDSVGGSNSTSTVISLDRRGLPSQMQVLAPPRSSQTIALATRNVAGLVTKQRTDQTGSMPFIESDWTYDHLGRVTSQLVQAGPGPIQVVRQDVAYFGNDDPKSLDHWLGASNHKQFTYAFDWRHQLTAVDETMLPHAFTASYQYGDAGRFTTATETSAGLSGADVKPRDVAYHYDGADPEEVTSLTTGSNSDPYAVYTYDDEGNQTSRCYGGTSGGACTGESVEYLYDGKDELRRATKKQAGVVESSEEYWYDGNGNRVATVKRDATGAKSELIWFLADAEAHYDAAGTLTHVYSYLGLGGPTVARIDRTGNTTTAWEYLFQGLGNSTLAAVDRDSGLVDASFDYAPFGEIVEATDGGGAGGAGIAAHRHRMNDKYIDEVSDLAYYGARYYDKTLIGWTQADPVYRFAPDARWANPRRGNLYSFSLNNPLRYIDPDGRDSRVSTPGPSLASYQIPEQDSLEGERRNEHEDDDLMQFDRVPLCCSSTSQPAWADQRVYDDDDAKEDNSPQGGPGATVDGDHLDMTFGGPATEGNERTIDGQEFRDFQNSRLKPDGFNFPDSNGRTGNLRFPTCTNDADDLPSGGVYTLGDLDGNVMRSGRSNDLERRENEHLRDPALKDYNFRVEFRTDDYAEQRGLEQVLHDSFQPPLNRVNPIGSRNPNLMNYLVAAFKYLERP